MRSRERRPLRLEREYVGMHPSDLHERVGCAVGALLSEPAPRTIGKEAAEEFPRHSPHTDQETPNSRGESLERKRKPHSSYRLLGRDRGAWRLTDV